MLFGARKERERERERESSKKATEKLSFAGDLVRMGRRLPVVMVLICLFSFQV
jgi:hypothetical protein